MIPPEVIRHYINYQSMQHYIEQYIYQSMQLRLKLHRTELRHDEDEFSNDNYLFIRVYKLFSKNNYLYKILIFDNKIVKKINTKKVD